MGESSWMRIFKAQVASIAGARVPGLEFQLWLKEFLALGLLIPIHNIEKAILVSL